MAVTFILSFIYFKFKYIIDSFLYALFRHIDDHYVFTCPCKASPINIYRVLVDGKDYTNKATLFFKYKWDKDICGITVSDLYLLKSDINRITVFYTTGDLNVFDFTIDSNELKINNNPVDVLFEELIFL